MSAAGMAAGIVARAIVGAALVVPVTVGTAHASPASCVDAWHAPHSATAAACRAHGWTVRARIVVGPHGWVRFNRLPHCREEDGSGQASPCTWNIGPGVDGNGIGLAYWLDGRDVTHYVRGTR